MYNVFHYSFLWFLLQGWIDNFNGPSGIFIAVRITENQLITVYSHNSICVFTIE